MGKIPQCIFLLALASIALIGMVNPKNLLKSFPTNTRLMGIDPNNPSKGALIFLRIANFVGFVFFLFVFIGVLTGKLRG